LSLNETMKNRKIIYWSLGFLFVTSIILGSILLFLGSDSKTKVTFLDVGQGDSILISNGSAQILVDGGESRKVLLEKLGRLIPFWDRKIEVLVLTHPDADHVSGLLGVLQSYEVKLIVVTGYDSQTKVQQAWEKLIEQENADVVDAVQGTKIVAGSNLTAEILFPFYSVDVSGKGKSNNSSVVMKIQSGQKSFLLTGDIAKREENEMIERGIDLSADVLKVAHHGSKNSTGEKFLSAVDPSEAIISVGADNKYGHPHENTLSALGNGEIEVLRTDKEGDVAYECDDKKCELIE